MKNLSFAILSALLFVVGLLLLLVYNEISTCNETCVVAAIVAVLVSIVPPMFYRSGIARKLVMVVHIVCVTVASHLLSVVWAEIFYAVCKTKGNKDTALLYASTAVVAYAMMTVAGHFMKRKPKPPYEAMERDDL
jgi:uncharacterized membrane protein